ncbi:MAG: hypothetical protein IT371_12330 [Deltaproteobacteria bacterium]|nr:hypothetical protein [Deltaproteobacteria bacterium]
MSDPRVKRPREQPPHQDGSGGRPPVEPPGRGQVASPHTTPYARQFAGSQMNEMTNVAGSVGGSAWDAEEGGLHGARTSLTTPVGAGPVPPVDWSDESAAPRPLPATRERAAPPRRPSGGHDAATPAQAPKAAAPAVAPPREPIPTAPPRPAGLDALPTDFMNRTVIVSSRATRVADGSEVQEASSEPRSAPEPAEMVRIQVQDGGASLRDRRLFVFLDPESPQAAAFRVLRHRLVERGDPRTVVVTSALPGEGKTTCAANLAAAMSECGRARVLLVDGHQRAPGLAGIFGIPSPPCFLQQALAQKERPGRPWSILQVGSPWLHMAAVAPGSPERKGIFDGRAFEIALDQLKRLPYDHIVIDAPPVLGNADVNLMQDAADGVLFALWARRSRGRHLRQAIDQLTTARLLGVALLQA